MRVKLPFYNNCVLANNTQSGRLVGFRANSAFDPEYELGGYSARGFATWATIYGMYLVRGFSYEITALPQTNAGLTVAASQFQLFSTIIPGNADSINQLPATMKDVQEYPRTKYWKGPVRFTRQTQDVGMPVTGWDTAAGRLKLKGFVNCHRFSKDWRSYGFQTTDVSKQWPVDYQANTTSNPSAGIDLWVGVFGQNQAGTPVSLPNIQVEYKFVYYVDFFSPDFPVSNEDAIDSKNEAPEPAGIDNEGEISVGGDVDSKIQVTDSNTNTNAADQ